MKTRLMHTRANVRDLNRSIQWYQDVLGFKVAASWPPEKPNYVHFDHEGGAMFAIMEQDHHPSVARFNFYVDDVDGLWEQVKDKGEVVEELFSTEYGSRKFTILDIDGNELGFVQDNL